MSTRTQVPARPFPRNGKPVAYEPICHWCKGDIDPSGIYRTPMSGIEPIGSIGWYVCSFDCPARPQGSRCFDNRRTIEL